VPALKTWELRVADTAAAGVDQIAPCQVGSQGTSSNDRADPDARARYEYREDGLLRIETVLVLLQIGRSTLYQGISEGRFPRPIHLGRRIARWRAAEIFKLIDIGVQLPRPGRRS
jgi:predicted DNA-binding transcriptional regulator AlpA